jgi:diacylglycerol O-acyltransferase
MAAEGHSSLSSLDSVIWRLDADPALRAAFATVSFLDRPPDPARLARRLSWAVADLPHFCDRVVPAPFPGAPPRWARDPDFDIARQLEWVDVADLPSSDGDEGDGRHREPAVLDLATRLAATPFDADRPLWGFVVVTGLPGGRAALVHRMHHALTDGEGGIRLSERYLDVAPDDAHVSDEHVPDPFPGAPAPEGTPLELFTLFAAEKVGDAARGASSATRWTIDGLRDPGRFVDAGAATLDAARSLGRQVTVVDSARSPMWTRRSHQHRLLPASVPFEVLREVATRTSTSINDVFVTAVVRAAGSFHRSAGHPVDELRVAVPVSTRKRTEGERGKGGNAFAPARALIPSGSGLTAGAHLRMVSARLSTLKSERSNEILGSLSAGAELIPTPVLTRLMRRQTSTIDVVTSNLRAAPFPLYVAGAHIEATYVVGPLMGTPVNVTMMSYDGRADMGVHVDAGAVEDPEGLRDRLVDAVSELHTAT